jgi:hypothetical protein
MKHRRRELLISFSLHVKPFFPSLKLPSFEDIKEGSDEDFLLYTVLANGRNSVLRLRCSRNEVRLYLTGAVCITEMEVSKQLVEKAQNILNHNLLHNSSIHIGNGLLLLTYYHTGGSTVEKSYSMAELAYKLSQVCSLVSYIEL